VDEYKSKISELEEQLNTYKTRERDMTDKLDKFRSDLDLANYKMHGLKSDKDELS